MARDKTTPTLLVDDTGDGKATLGCLGGLLVVALVGGAIALFVDFEASDDTITSALDELPITRVEALDKQGGSADGPGSLLARNLQAEGDRGAVAGRSGVVADLLADFYENGIEPETLQREMKRRSVCYNGRPARIGPLVLARDSQGFALAFGAPSFNEGDPFPRLEFFHGIAGDLDTLYYVSLTHEPVPGFEPVGRRIPNTRKAVGRVMLEWVAEVANTACPRSGS
ncbi:hypothetical protein F1188_17640 [Roseospira marina]|uniref:Uncharacterized protein n=1 Tax=Roseospira marina TaxID=140057 RepID=A0A5M6I769_9PROT|nr:hypothetical protein [Roseospira marina]KAA5604111.1 hypothetical protein F1188_17640 [Roseospira marina]MBB4315788.1 hypothetical protein [Roseospira marina]MBB5088973.1 hypothetical protein [Roseospira marina]